MRFAGVDLHKLEIEAAIVDEHGALVHRQRFPCRREALEAFARAHLKDACVAVEATFHTWPIVTLLEPLVAEVVVSNPLRTKAIAQAKIKTDKVGAGAGAASARGLPAAGVEAGPGHPSPAPAHHRARESGQRPHAA
jgi:hypothetical protein